ncbi:acetate--CoA ligase family protein [Desulfotignum phosphitoxidans]|jgi:acyl-CoA synthetase (NDP forming)|uniref:CoA-binding domain-containing protein n=1 Tax=Desulfotignum phosphitoxidans DSM 13687 TaxID=1286635 RepID=S0G7B4_9BACT|nr:acetate--CoA ligase family protein [Desulfotignum phosphitoxidans]EMS81032.1 CoA-binding domain-containing protein [Desulfotignum phosphitoxidans DSM 13687]
MGLQPELRIDFDAITELFTEAEQQGRNVLFEYETYRMLADSGAETPPSFNFIVKGSQPSNEVIDAMPGDKVVLKIVSPGIIHKTEADGVRIVEKKPEKIRSAIRRMMYEVPDALCDLIERQKIHSPGAYSGLTGDALKDAVVQDICGVLIVQFMPPDSESFGNELIVGIRYTREFGMVISAGLGGTDTELYAERFRTGQAIVTASTAMTDGDTFFGFFKKTISYKKLAGLTRGQRRIVTDEQLIECFSSFIAMANYYSPNNSQTPYVIDELEINPFAFTDYLMVPLDGMCRFSRSVSLPVQRPFHKVGHLLHPVKIGIIGVSTQRVNFGRLILNNILANGYNPEDICIVKPGLDMFEGILCVPDLASLDMKLDLFVVAVNAQQVPDLVDEIIFHDAANAVMLIPGGMGETAESEDRARQLVHKISEAHLKEGGGPVFLGANCLGVVSHPGKYDTLFIPEVKLPKRRGDHKRNTAFVSQSGAFMITRLSKCPEIDPAYMISVGNQNDLTLGDIVKYLKDDPDITVIAVYAEGFKDLDGLEFSRAVREAVQNGKEVIFYKAGRTPEGKTATSGHTASLAGDYMVCESCVRQAGGMIARTFPQFENLIMLSQRLHDKQIHGTRLAAVSGAGFEAVGMADNIRSDEYSLQMAGFTDDTTRKLSKFLAVKRLDSLVEVKNPLDINPAADDETHVTVVRYLAEDPNVDAVVVGLDPLSPAMRTLAECKAKKYNMDDKESIALQMPKLASELSKPVIGVVDGGYLYEPLVNKLLSQGMTVFRSSDRAIHSLAIYIEGRLYAAQIR